MSDILSRNEFGEDVAACNNGWEYAARNLRKHDSAQRARIEELEAKLAALQHIGTGAGQAVGHKHE